MRPGFLDDPLDTERFIRRVAYAKPVPLLRPYERITSAFFAKLLDELLTSHSSLVRVGDNERTMQAFATRLRKEIPKGLYEVGVKRVSVTEWAVLVYNPITMTLAMPEWMGLPDEQDTRPEWMGIPEAAQYLGRSYEHTRLLIKKHCGTVRREGGRNQIFVHRSDLAILANRKGRHRRKRTT